MFLSTHYPLRSIPFGSFFTIAILAFTLFLPSVAYAADLDGDGIDNTVDVDDDNDGILDTAESCDYASANASMDNRWSYEHYLDTTAPLGDESLYTFDVSGWTYPPVTPDGLLQRNLAPLTSTSTGTVANTATVPAAIDFTTDDESMALTGYIIQPPGTMLDLVFTNGDKFDHMYIVANDTAGNLLGSVPAYYKESAQVDTIANVTVPADGIIVLTVYVGDLGVRHDIASGFFSFQNAARSRDWKYAARTAQIDHREEV